jgi:hypothetical protein
MPQAVLDGSGGAGDVAGTQLKLAGRKFVAKMKGEDSVDARTAELGFDAAQEAAGERVGGRPSTGGCHFEGDVGEAVLSFLAGVDGEEAGKFGEGADERSDVAIDTGVVAGDSNLDLLVPGLCV